MTTDPIERELLMGLARNERKATETIYKQHYNMVQAMVINNSGTADDARDIFQEAIMVVYEKVKSDEFELHCRLKTYIYSVARRLWLKRLQQITRFSSEVDDVAESVPVEEELEQHELQNQAFHMMEKAMHSIGEPCKSLLESYYIHKKNMAEIAGDFGYTNADNAKNQKYKCLTRLKKLFFAQYKNQAV
ncbi:RNA polymerase sigma factor [Flavihumibacter sp. ZG627]|uniref:RNA polymerase sigma factor n=1 Tax=Flavihumibacter sp. ZG627 TaxID=1463156 RepID=UPI00057EAEF3|nr:sigma-70 family RNA polymerase sigma factor [Flavihumibacter sp. ZG627]KIC91568.1 RNA polymerase subunit sigma-70 [Flavihumibacter sp. ZG627]